MNTNIHCQECDDIVFAQQDMHPNQVYLWCEK